MPTTATEYGIVDQAHVESFDQYAMSRVVNPKPFQIDDLLRTVDRYNAELRRKQNRYHELKDKHGEELTREEFDIVHEWVRGTYSNDIPACERHYVLVKREITAWEEVTS